MSLTRGTALEFDVTMDDAQSWAARKLERSNWLTWLAADDAIVELGLNADPSDRGAVGALVRTRRDSDSPGDSAGHRPVALRKRPEISKAIRIWVTVSRIKTRGGLAMTDSWP